MPVPPLLAPAGLAVKASVAAQARTAEPASFLDIEFEFGNVK